MRRTGRVRFCGFTRKYSYFRRYSEVSGCWASGVSGVARRASLLSAPRESIFGRLDELNGLLALDGREASKEIFEGGVAFDLVDEHLNGDAGSVEARCAAEPVYIDPDEVVEQGSLFSHHTYKLRER